MATTGKVLILRTGLLQVVGGLVCCYREINSTLPWYLKAKKFKHLLYLTVTN